MPPHGSPAPPDERPRRWQYPVGAVVLVLMLLVALWFRSCRDVPPPGTPVQSSMRMKRPAASWRVLAALALLLLSASGLRAQPATGEIRGRVRTERGTFLEGASVRVDGTALELALAVLRSADERRVIDV